MSRYSSCTYDTDCNDDYYCCSEYDGESKDTYTYMCDTQKGCDDKGQIPDDKGL